MRGNKRTGWFSLPGVGVVRVARVGEIYFATHHDRVGGRPQAAGDVLSVNKWRKLKPLLGTPDPKHVRAACPECGADVRDELYAKFKVFEGEYRIVCPRCGACLVVEVEQVLKVRLYGGE